MSDTNSSSPATVEELRAELAAQRELLAAVIENVQRLNGLQGQIVGAIKAVRDVLCDVPDGPALAIVAGEDGPEMLERLQEMLSPEAYDAMVTDAFKSMFSAAAGQTDDDPTAPATLQERVERLEEFCLITSGRAASVVDARERILDAVHGRAPEATDGDGEPDA